MGRLRDVFRAEPWHYLLSLWLLVAMLLAYVLAGAEARFWDWFARRTV